MLSPEQVTAIRDIFRRRHNAVIGSVFGTDVLTEDERAELNDAGINLKDDAGDVLLLAYELGKLQAGEPTRAQARELESLPAPTETTRSQMAAARATAAVHVRGLSDRVLADVGKLITAEQQRQTIRDVVAEGAQATVSIQTLRSELGHRLPDWERDLERLAQTELHTAREEGQAEKIRERTPKAQVYKVPAPDACSDCQRLHLGPDGRPRVFELDSLAPSNVGRKRNDWVVTVGSTHPNCTCTLRELPEGWGFNDDGEAVPGGEQPQIYDGMEAMEKAVIAEDRWHKEALHGQLFVDGQLVLVEDVRVKDDRLLSASGKSADGKKLLLGPSPSEGEPISIAGVSCLGFPGAQMAQEAYIYHIHKALVQMPVEKPTAGPIDHPAAPLSSFAQELDIRRRHRNRTFADPRDLNFHREPKEPSPLPEIDRQPHTDWRRNREHLESHAQRRRY